jgi:nicotinamide-nucleotide amidase
VASAEIVAIGTELLLGHLIDTNSHAIAQALAGAGMDVHRHTAVGDNADRIAAVVSEALARADAVICTGGLGPTVDDMTREGIAKALGRELRLDDESLSQIRARFKRLGRAMTPNNERQAMLPAGATAIPNPDGTAPGFIVDDGTRAIIAVPGVPGEMRAMLERNVIPFLVERFHLRAVIVTRVLHTIGETESAIDTRIADLFRAGINPSIAVLAHAGQIDVKITAKAPTLGEAHSLIGQLEPQLRERLGDCVFGADGESLEKVVGDGLRARSWTLAVAESCTGGMLGEMITRVPGSSDYFLGGVVAYGDDVKAACLNVPAELIARHGAVSREACAAMAEGVKAELGSDVSLSITGIAGPDGGTPEKPVGLVYVGLARADGSVEVRTLRLVGDRELVRRRAALAALTLAWKATRAKEDGRPSATATQR